MPLNIKNEKVTSLAQDLARRTGRSITEAVGDAIEARLLELDRLKSREGVADRLNAIGERVARLAPKEWLECDFDKELYDENGLPK